MRSIFQRIHEIRSDKELKRWVRWKLIHPLDQGTSSPSSYGIPPYLETLKLTPHQATAKTPQLPTLVAWPAFSSGKPSGQSLRLANQTIPAPESPSRLFALTFEDPEDTAAVHRFAWLPFSEQSIHEIESWIFHWIKNPPPLDLDPAWEAYSIAERLAHWGLFLCRSRVHERWDVSRASVFQASIIQQCDVLAGRLEYFGETLTGNHLANNARGLLWGSLLSSSDRYHAWAQEILIQETKRIFQKEGILREGSSHYQLLITRNIAECFWLAQELGLSKLENFLKSLLPTLLEACRFFRLPNGEIPRMGDISPDSPPEFLVHLESLVESWLHSPTGSGFVPAQGWASHFSENVPSPRGQESGLHFAEKRDDFARIQTQDYTAFVRINAAGYPILASHCHRDSGCPVVYFSQKPLLLDSGRKSYLQSDSTAQMQVSALGHNTVLLDGEELELRPRGVFGPGYLSYRTGGAPELEVLKKPSPAILTRHFGWKQNGVVLTREIRLENDQVVLKFDLKGSGKHEVTLLMHLPKTQNVRIIWPDGGHASSTSSICSKTYGSQAEVTTWRWQGLVTLPWNGKIRVQPDTGKDSAS